MASMIYNCVYLLVYIYIFIAKYGTRNPVLGVFSVFSDFFPEGLDVICLTS